MRKDILKLDNNDLTLKIDGNEISSVRNKNILKKGARVFRDGKIYSSSFVGNIDDDKLIELALDNADGTLEYDYPLPECKNICANAFNHEGKNRNVLYSEYVEVLSFLVKEFPNFIFSGNAHLSRINRELIIVDQATQKVGYDLCNWHFLYKHKKSAGIADGYFGAVTLGDFNFKKEVANYQKFLNVFENNVSIQPGRYPVVFTTSNELLPKLLENMRADYYKKDIGLYKGMLGKKILNSKFSLFDISYMPKKCATNLFDGEGVVRENPILPLIKNGIFQNLICDLRNAKKYNLKPTGNGQRNFNTNTYLDYNSVLVEEGKRSSQEILNDLPTCLIVEMAAGGDFTDNGDYSTPVQNGFLSKNGTIVGKLPQITLKTSMQKMFGDDLLEIANNSLSGFDYNPALFIEMDIFIN